MPIPPTFFTLLLLKALWQRGMGKMPIPPTFYSFTFLLLKYKVTVFSANIGYACNKEQENLSLNLRHNRKKQ